MKKVLIYSFILYSIFTVSVFAEITDRVVKGEVSEIISEKYEEIGFDGMKIKIQEIKIQLEDGNVIETTNDLIDMKVGQNVFVSHQKYDEDEVYLLQGIDRTVPITLLFLIFVAVVIFFGKKHGLRSLFSLSISFIIIFYLLIPLLVKGYSTLFVGIPIIAFLLAIVIYATHGLDKKSTVAVIGTTSSIIITGFLAYVFIDAAKLTGFFSDDTTYLNVVTEGTLDFKGLLFTGIIMGILGVLDDIAITQVAVVAEMKNLKEKISKKEIWTKAMNVGRHHIGALINTLVLAYAGISLPLLMYLSKTDGGFLFKINQEVFATEIVRTLIGSIGLIITVPITTYLAIILLKNK